METIKRSTCRMCGNDSLGKRLSLGDLYVSDFLPTPNSTGRTKAPLTLVECSACHLVQLSHTAPMELMYSGHYWYRSGLSPVISSDLADIAKWGILESGAQGNDLVLDIGSNDGSFLRAVAEINPKLVRVGVEPATNLFEMTKEASHLAFNDFWPLKIEWRMQKAKLIVAAGMFYDLENPNAFVKGMKKVLADDGVIVAQLMTAKQMLEKTDIGNICHEHLEFYDYKALVQLFESNGLEIYRVEENSINGGSYRLFITHFQEGSVAHPEADLDWRGFRDRIIKNKQDTVAFLEAAKKAGKRIFAYGASTKGSGILQYYGVDAALIEGVADKSPEKWGKYTVGTHIPIVKEEYARLHADIFWVLPYAFLDTFLEREAEWREKGGIFITSTPEFKAL